MISKETADKYRQKNILIAGLARSGRSAFKLLSNLGAKVTCYDVKKKAELKKDGELPKNLICDTPPEDIDVTNYDIIVTSPGLHKDNSLITKAITSKIPVISELELGLTLLPEVKIIAVTGTNGKTTTVKLIEFLTKAKLAGNVGTPLTSVIDKINKGDILVLEVSSYQIPFSPSLSPEVGVLLNIFPEHLAWHGSYENYVEDKMLMFKRQSKDKYTILNTSIETKYLKQAESFKGKKYFFPASRKKRGTFIEGDSIYFNNGKTCKKLVGIDRYRLIGEHNLDNLMAAVLAAYLTGVRKFPDIAKFSVPAHRLEEVAEIEGVKYINDSKGTNMDSVYRAVKSIEAPIVLLMGGRSKGATHPLLKDLIKTKVKKIIAFGESRNELEDYFNISSLVKTKTLKEGVELAKDITQPGDVVLLSPGGSSFDEFKDYRDRGDKFKRWVKE